MCHHYEMSRRIYLGVYWRFIGFLSSFIRHLLRTGGIQDLVIVSERQMVKGISRIIAVTGDGAKKVRAIMASGVALET